MNKIEIFNLHPLHSGEHYQFMYEIKVAIATYTAQVLGLTEILPRFLAALEKEDVALKAEQGSAKSSTAKSLEALRDHTWKSANLRIEAALESPFSDEVESGKAIRRIFDIYGDIRRHPNNQESGEMTNITADLLKPENEPHLIKLNLQRIVPELDKENKDYINVVDDRNVEIARRVKINMEMARAEVDPLYEEIVETVNATITLNLAKPGVETFVNELNQRIKTYQTTITTRETLNQKKSNKK